MNYIKLEIKKLFHNFFDIEIPQNNLKWVSKKSELEGRGWYLIGEGVHQKINFGNEREEDKGQYLKSLLVWNYGKFLSDKHNYQFIAEKIGGKILPDKRTYLTIAYKGKKVYLFSDFYKLEKLDNKGILQRDYQIESIPIIRGTYLSFFDNKPIENLSNFCILYGENFAKLFEDKSIAYNYKDRCFGKVISKCGYLDIKQLYTKDIDTYNDIDKGLYEKYCVEKFNEETEKFEFNPDKFYFILSPEKDPIALEALKFYRDKTDNLNLKNDLSIKINNIEMQNFSVEKSGFEFEIMVDKLGRRKSV